MEGMDIKLRSSSSKIVLLS